MGKSTAIEAPTDSPMMAALVCPSLGVEEEVGGMYVRGVLGKGREGVGRFDALRNTICLGSLFTDVCNLPAIRKGNSNTPNIEPPTTAIWPIHIRYIRHT